MNDRDVQRRTPMNPKPMKSSAPHSMISRSLLAGACAIVAATMWTAAPVSAQNSDPASRVVEALNRGETDPEKLIGIITDQSRTPRPTAGTRVRTAERSDSSRGRVSRTDEFREAFNTIVQSPGNTLMRLRFAPDTELGERSYIQLISLEDGGHQKFTAQSLATWQNWSAIFNGDAVEVQLH